MATVLPYRGPVHGVAVQTTAAVTGGRFVAVSANAAPGPALSRTALQKNIQVAHCGAGAMARGVASTDASASGVFLTAFDQGTVPVEAGATLTAGQQVESDSVGRAIPLNTGKALGTVERDTASASLAPIKINLA